MPSVVFEIVPKGELVVGRGCVVVVSGYNRDVDNPLTSLQLCIDDNWQTVKYLNERRDDLSMSLTGDDSAISRVGFWGTYQLDTSFSTGPVTIRYSALFSDKTKETGTVTDIILESTLRPPSDDKASLTTGAPVTICMTTYEPNEEFLEVQLRSIQEQSYQEWVCLICDDYSSESTLSVIERLCQEEPRFHLLKNPDNVGFYLNFERCLRNVPRDSQFIALCDQDDVWHPDKLQRLLQEFDNSTSLVYSDMRLVDAKGEVLSDTYWSDRKNNYSKLDVLLVANTITGAASFFRASLLDLILPFPERIGDAYHDHWVALVAFLGGDIRYVDEPLYDYRQHGENIIGQTVFENDKGSVSIWQSIRTEFKASFSQSVIKNEEAPSAPQPSESSVAPVSIVEEHAKSAALAEPQGEGTPVQQVSARNPQDEEVALIELQTTNLPDQQDAPTANDTVQNGPRIKSEIGLTSFPRFEYNRVKFQKPASDPMTDHRSAVRRAISFLVISSHFWVLVTVNLARYCVRFLVIGAHHIILVAINLARYCVRFVVIGAHHIILVAINLARHCVRYLVIGAHHIILVTLHWIRFLVQICLHWLRSSSNIVLLISRQTILGSLSAIISVAQRSGLQFLIRPLVRDLIAREHHKSQYEFFRHQCRSLELFSQTLRLRFNDWDFDDDTHRALNIFGHGRTSARYLQRMSRQAQGDGETMGGREMAMANGYLAATLEWSVAGNKSIVDGRYRTE
jgi:hypothetical protein